MRTRRLNWVILLVGALACLAIGAVGVAAGEAVRTTVWFILGAVLLVGSGILYRMRLP